jgi:hypothetical protein
MRLLAIILISLLFSCKVCEKGKTAEAQNKEVIREKTETIAFTEVKSGENSDYNKAQNLVISTQAEMDAAWMMMFGKYPRKPPIPMVDFETKQLLLVTMGEQPNGGYSIKVSSIVKSPKGMVVTIEDAKPGKTCNNTSALIYPFQLIEMPKTDEKLSYLRVSKVNDCEE